MRRLMLSARRLAAPVTSFVLIAAIGLLVGSNAGAVEIRNTAVGGVQGKPLDSDAAIVRLVRLGTPASAATAEISPNEVLVGQPGAFAYDVLPTIGAGDTGIDRVTITAPTGYSNLAVTAAHVGATALAAGCPTPGSGEYCATVAGSDLTVALGDRVATSGTNIRIDFTADSPVATGADNFTSVVADGPGGLATVEGEADGDPADANSIAVSVLQSQGLVLELAKLAATPEAVVGGIVTYAIEIRNTTDGDVVGVRIADRIPPNFKYVRGSARLDGAPLPDPAGPRPLVFEIGVVPGHLDSNGNGEVDPDEPGFRSLLYQLVVGAGAMPGTFTNRAVAIDFCDGCEISNESTARVEIVLDPTFDLGRIIGKVFHDTNRDGRQDPGEPGIGGAMVALDDGTYALTDGFGRYHFPQVLPGQRMVKINLHTLPPGSVATGHKSRILWVTPGLMQRANFGVAIERETVGAGSPAELGMRVTATPRDDGVEIAGDVDTREIEVAGQGLTLPSATVRLGIEMLGERLRLENDELLDPAEFTFEVSDPDDIERWTLTIFDGDGSAFRAIQGSGTPPESIEWDGKSGAGRPPVSGEIYPYELELAYRDGSRVTSARRMFGVNRTMAIRLQLSLDAFEFDSSTLTPHAQEVLDLVADYLERFLDEKIVLDGHTDSEGTRRYNETLSRRRAEATAEFLSRNHGVSRDRFVLRWFGEDRPVASNETDEGRALNRRVEIRGGEDPVAPPRSEPRVRINGTPVEIDDDGRFATRVTDVPAGGITVEVQAGDGSRTQATARPPSIELTAPHGYVVLARGGCRISGRTEPGNTLSVDGQPVEVGADGAFSFERAIPPGDRRVGIEATSPEGLVRRATLDVEVTDREARGDRIVLRDGTPWLSVDLPPEGSRLKQPLWPLSGETTPGNSVRVNGQPVDVGADGKFSLLLELERGSNPFSVTAKDPTGAVSTIERTIEVSRHELFLLAFADGRVSKLDGSGMIDGSGVDEDDDYFVDGRLAFYLKGTISGKYLITSALDTGAGEAEYLFRDVDVGREGILLRNIDPDRDYLVYGDSSTVVFDAQSQGKFYLAVDSDTISAMVGDYPLQLDDTELAAYQRTLYGARFAYRSASRTRYGDHDTDVVLFGAEVKQTHVRDELRATGGSLYYLSRRDVLEGSEQITIVVRDRDTGLVLSRERQEQNRDYTVKYIEGRVMFQRPIAQVAQAAGLVDRDVLHGNPVFIEIAYEARVDDFEKTGGGGRVRQQIGDHLAVGATYIQDEQRAESYELSGVDTELRLGKNTRIFGEYAESEGADARVFASNDGGLSYQQDTQGVGREGAAWKVGAEVDFGEWFAKPDRYRAAGYYKKLNPGFSSNGNFLEQGTEKIGLNASARLTERDLLLGSFTREERTLPPAAPAGAAAEIRQGSVQWTRKGVDWGVGVEFLKRETDDVAGNSLSSTTFGAGQFWKRFTEKLTGRVTHQETLSGPENDQSTVGVEYQALERLRLEAQGTTGTIGESAQIGATLSVGEGSIYVTERVADNGVGRTTSTVMGARSPLGESSKVYTEYQREQSPSGERMLSIVGLQRQWDPAPGFRIVLSGEGADIDDTTGGTDRTALTVGLSFADPERLTVQTRNQWLFERGRRDRDQFFSVSQLDYVLSNDFTLLTKYRYSKTRDTNLDVDEAKLDERVIGVAYRPTRWDRFNSLLKYTRLVGQRPITLVDPLRIESTTSVFSLDTAFEIHPRLEWLAKEAWRKQSERVAFLPEVESESYLVIQRLNWNVWRPIDLAAEYRILDQRLADDRRRGWLSEASWRIKENFRFGLGYNFTDFSDDELSTGDYDVGGWFLRIQGMY